MGFLEKEERGMCGIGLFFFFRIKSFSREIKNCLGRSIKKLKKIFIKNYFFIYF
jgi:hypothetical protein